MGVVRAWSWSQVRKVSGHPSLWFTAVRQGLRLAEPGWWHRWPPVPSVPDSYMRFRLVTAYGDPEAELEDDDVVTYLRWCRTWRALAR